MTVKIFIVEDQALILKSLAITLDSVSDFQVVGTALNGEELFTSSNGAKPDIILMDIRMPKMSGEEATRKIDEKMPWVKVIALSMYDHPHMIKEMLRAGAKGFLSKQSSFEELCEAIRTVHAGSTYLCKRCRDSVLSTFLQNGEASVSKIEGLTSRELEVIKLLADGLTTEEIARQLSISAKTVERHKSNILGKLNLKNTAQLIRFSIEQGILLS